jgi:hypothetical protein
MSEIDKGMDIERKKVSGEPSASQVSFTRVGRENLSDSLAPHESYEGRHRYDPGATGQRRRRGELCGRRTYIFCLGYA